LVNALGLAPLPAAAQSPEPPQTLPAEVAALIRELGGRDAGAEHRASRRLAALGAAAVPALAGVAATGSVYVARMAAVELLGQTGTTAALERMIEQLRTERNLAVRGQICIQLGYARDPRAVAVLCEWLKTIGPSALNDVRGAKEVQPSTCYLRHLEALGMIGDEQAVPAIEEFARRLPRNVGHGGFITSFVEEGIRDALNRIRTQSAFWRSVRRRPGLAERVGPLFAYLHGDPVARFRLHADDVVGRTAAGRTLLVELRRHPDAAIADAAAELLGLSD
jgi:HEAT repeat protein